MKFKYLSDPLFMFCLALYAVNRWGLKHIFPSGFFHNHLNDLICIPFWVPIMLFAMRKLGARKDDAPPRASEVLIPLVLWSALFELILPNTALFRGLAIGDQNDIVCYALGACAATFIWNCLYPQTPSTATENASVALSAPQEEAK